MNDQETAIQKRLIARGLAIRGFCFKKLGKMQECIESLHEALEADCSGTYVFAMKQLAVCYGKSGDFDNALKWAKEAGEFKLAEKVAQAINKKKDAALKKEPPSKRQRTDRV